MTLRLSELVSDWGGFERLIASLHETGSVSVQHNVTLKGRSGTPRQIDVVVTHREGLYDHLIIVECKYWRKNVGRQQVDALASAVRDLGASRGVIFSASGFQRGAIAAAKYEHVELYKVRDVAESDWGAPGRVVEFLLHFYQASMGDLKVHRASAIGSPSTELAIQLGLSQSSTPTWRSLDEQPGPTLESILERSMWDAMHRATKDHFRIGGGVECTVYATVNLNFDLSAKPILIPRANGLLLLESFSCQLGIKINQSPFRMDRLEPLQFALVLEDCIREVAQSASKRHGEEGVRLAPLNSGESQANDAVQNGSVLKIYLKDFFAFDEIAKGPLIQLPSALRAEKLELSIAEMMDSATPSASNAAIEP